MDVLAERTQTIAKMIKKFKLVPRTSRIRLMTRAWESARLNTTVLIFVDRFFFGSFVGTIENVASPLFRRCSKLGNSIPLLSYPNLRSKRLNSNRTTLDQNHRSSKRIFGSDPILIENWHDNNTSASIRKQSVTKTWNNRKDNN